MNFSDIDFSAISRMMASLSEEEKESLNTMAQNMMDNMKKPQEDLQEEEEEEDLFSALKLDEDRYAQLPGSVLTMIEAGHDMESYYEDDAEADLSAAVLYYCKALLFLLRKYAGPILQSQQLLSVPLPASALQHFYSVLADPSELQKLLENSIGSEASLERIRQILQQSCILLSRAEYDTIQVPDLEVLKEMLFKEDGLLLIQEVFQPAES